MVDQRALATGLLTLIVVVGGLWFVDAYNLTGSEYCKTVDFSINGTTFDTKQELTDKLDALNSAKTVEDLNIVEADEGPLEQGIYCQSGDVPS